MTGTRQTIQYSLALERGDRGETPVSGYQGAEPVVAKPAPESPALTEQLMEEVCDRANLVRAWKRVRQNQGSPGVDRMTIGDASAHAGSPWRRRWSSYRRQDCPGSGERVSTLLQDLLDPTRSGLRPSFPARPICCSAFRPWSASLALPTAWPTMPSADFCRAVRRPLGRLSRRNGDTPQISRGKLNRLRCTAAGSTLRAVDGYGLRDTLPARPMLAPRIRFLSIGSHLCFALPSDPASRR